MKSRRPPFDDRLAPDVDDALLGAVAPVAPPSALRARVLERVRLDADVEESDWRFVAPGMKVKTLFQDKTAGMVSFLLRADAGASMPPHVHHAFEECLVLEGEFILGDRVLQPGDFELGRPGEQHPMSSTRTGVLVYLRGAMEDYPFACL